MLDNQFLNDLAGFDIDEIENLFDGVRRGLRSL
jgi:hypothetical protein